MAAEGNYFKGQKFERQLHVYIKTGSQNITQKNFSYTNLNHYRMFVNKKDKYHLRGGIGDIKTVLQYCWCKQGR